MKYALWATSVLNQNKICSTIIGIHLERQNVMLIRSQVPQIKLSDLQATRQTDEQTQIPLCLYLICTKVHFQTRIWLFYSLSFINCVLTGLNNCLF